MGGECRNPDHAGDAAGCCGGCAREREAELTALNDRYMRLLGERADWERRTRSAAIRAEHDYLRTSIDAILHGLWQEAGPVAEVSAVVGRASMVDPEWGRTKDAREKLAELRRQGEHAFRAWHQRLAQTGEAFLSAPGETEIARLRQVIVTAARRLHRETVDVPSPAPPGWSCCCAGCELIRDMDDVSLPGIDQPVKRRERPSFLPDPQGSA